MRSMPKLSRTAGPALRRAIPREPRSQCNQAVTASAPPQTSVVFLCFASALCKMTSSASILASKYPAKAHARRVAESLKARHGGAGAIYLEAQKTRLIEDNDEAQPFRYASTGSLGDASA